MLEGEQDQASSFFEENRFYSMLEGRSVEEEGGLRWDHVFSDGDVQLPDYSNMPNSRLTSLSIFHSLVTVFSGIVSLTRPVPLSA